MKPHHLHQYRLMFSVASCSIAVTVVGQLFYTVNLKHVLHRWWEDDYFLVTQNFKKSPGETWELSCHFCVIFELWHYWKGENLNLCLSLAEREYGPPVVTELEQNVKWRNCRNTRGDAMENLLSKAQECAQTWSHLSGIIFNKHVVCI